MENTSFGSSITPQVIIKPARSHVFLVALIVVSAICYIVGFQFLSKGMSSAWVPLLIGIYLSGFAIWGWFASQRDVDLENCTPTHIMDSLGNALSTDTRALTSPKIIQGIEKIFSTFSHREPLPLPDGLVDQSGKPIPNTKDEAVKMVEGINELVRQSTQKFTSCLNSAKPITQEAQPILDEPISDILINTNKYEEQA